MGYTPMGYTPWGIPQEVYHRPGPMGVYPTGYTPGQARPHYTSTRLLYKHPITIQAPDYYTSTQLLHKHPTNKQEARSKKQETTVNKQQATSCRFEVGPRSVQCRSEVGPRSVRGYTPWGIPHGVYLRPGPRVRGYHLDLTGMVLD